MRQPPGEPRTATTLPLRSKMIVGVIDDIGRLPAAGAFARRWLSFVGSNEKSVS